MRLIDADALLEHLNKSWYGDVTEEIKRAPTIIWCSKTSEGYPFMDLRPREKGEWINHINDNGHNIADCPLCGKTTQWHDEDADGIPKYCWYCGARMEGGAK